jgi:hypothetical protein
VIFFGEGELEKEVLSRLTEQHPDVVFIDAVQFARGLMVIEKRRQLDATFSLQKISGEKFREEKLLLERGREYENFALKELTLIKTRNWLTRIGCSSVTLAAGD